MTHRLPLVVGLSTLLAAAASAHQLPNFDASSLLRAEPSAAVRAAAARVSAGAKIPTEWYPQYGTPSFVWAAGSDTARAEATAMSANATGAYVSEVHDIGHGPIIVRYRQRIDGIDVFRNEMNVVVRRSDNRVIAVSGHLADRAGTVASASTASPFRLSPSEAAAVAIAELDGGTVERSNRVWFDLGAALEPAYSIEISDDETTYAYVISAANGQLLFRKNLMEEDSPYTYRVWIDPVTKRPLKGPQGFAGDPHPTGTNDGFQATFVPPTLVTLSAGPISTGDPWLPPGALVTTGNNTDAYIDANAPDGFSGGDVRGTTNGPNTFDHSQDPQSQPSASAEQRQGAIMQLFYTVNYLHDWFYDSGFDEVARNAQTNNYGRGGAGNDSIRAEAQDYSGRNNANMTTPADGGRPRMQMYIFDAVTFRALDVDAPASVAARYGVGTAQFGPQSFNLSGDVVAVDPADGCTAFNSPVTGKIAFVDRGNCIFSVKAQNAKAAGAIGLIVGNVPSSVNPTSFAGMSCTASVCTSAETALVPSLQVPLATADAFRAQLAKGSIHATLRRDAGFDRDGAVDNAVVAHEWAHYLSNRLIANSSGLASPQSRGMGEGWSDFNALLLMVRPEDVSIPSNATFNGVFPMASYVTSGGGNGPDPNGGYYFGIRRVPYSTDLSRDPLTLKHIGRGAAISGAPVAFGADGGNNAEVHSTGEVWATMLWECYAALLRDTLGDHPRLTFQQAQRRMSDYLVASLKITPFDPTFLDARNALLAAAFATDPADYEDFWQAFAKRGAGIRAAVSERYSTINAGVSEDFTVGPDAAIQSVAIDDSLSTCKKNGALEGGESGLVTVTIRNSGDAHLAATTGHVSADDARVQLAGGGLLTFPPSDPGQTVSATARVTLAPGTAALTPNFTVSISDPAFVAGETTSTTAFRLNVHDEFKQSSTDDFETTRTAWSPGSTTRWSVLELAPTQHVWAASERGAQSDSSLTSPPIVVSRVTPFRITFKHRHWFDITTDTNGNPLAVDGGVVEISDALGNVWTDIGNLASPGYGDTPILASNLNPLQNRRAFIGLSPGATLETPSTSPFTTSVIDLGMAYAGQIVRIRFRMGTGQGHSGAPLLGWQIDEVQLSGATNLPFLASVPDNGVCGEGVAIVTIKALGAPTLLQVNVTSTFGTPTGSVDLIENGNVFASALLTNGVATFDPKFYLLPGTHIINAVYNGSQNFNNALTSTPVTITIPPPARRHAAR
jgi:hypothetical protein